MSGCGCSKETPCEDKKSQQENHPSIAEANNSKNCDNTLSCCGEEEEKKSSSPCCNTSNSCEDTAQSCCGSDPKENLSTEDVLKDSHYMSEYLVPKMDCSAEEQMVRMALSSIDGVQKLIFDLPIHLNTPFLSYFLFNSLHSAIKAASSCSKVVSPFKIRWCLASS